MTKEGPGLHGRRLPCKKKGQLGANLMSSANGVIKNGALPNRRSEK